MSEGGFVFNNTVTGNGTNIAQGQTVTQDIKQTFGGDGLPTVAQVFQAVEKEIEQSLPPETAEEIKTGVIQPLCAMAELPIDEQKSDAIKQQAEPLYLKLAPYAPAISKAIMTFGEAALTALASSNPIVAGLVAVCRNAKEQSALA